MKILHIADVHLGAEPDKDKPWGAGREKLQWDAFEQAIAAAEEQQVDLVLIAGDLFHRQPLKRELKEVNEILSQLSRAKVVIMAGNHDYLTRNSFYRTFLWGENIHFLKSEEMECLDFPELSTYVYGFSYEHREIHQTRYSNIHKQGNGYHILLAHGGDESHVPLRLKHLEELEFDYIALGHIHKPVQLRENRIIMAGALQPLDSTDTGAHGYWIVELKRGVADAVFYPILGCEYVEVELDIMPQTTQRQMMKMAEKRLTELEHYQLARMIVNGCYNPEILTDMDCLKELEKVVAVELLCRPDYNFSKLKQEYDNQIIGRYIRELENLPQDEVVRKALYLGVDALMGISDVY